MSVLTGRREDRCPHPRYRSPAESRRQPASRGSGQHIGHGRDHITRQGRECRPPAPRTPRSMARLAVLAGRPTPTSSGPRARIPHSSLCARALLRPRISDMVQIEASLLSRGVFGGCWGALVDARGGRRAGGRRVRVGSGADLSEVPGSGFKPAALDSRVAPVCRPGPTRFSGRVGVVATRRRRRGASTHGVLLCGSCPRLACAGSRRGRACRGRLG